MPAMVSYRRKPIPRTRTDSHVTGWIANAHIHASRRIWNAWKDPAQPGLRRVLFSVDRFENTADRLENTIDLVLFDDERR